MLFWWCVASPSIFHDWAVVRPAAWAVIALALGVVVHTVLNSFGRFLGPVCWPGAFAFWLPLGGFPFLALAPIKALVIAFEGRVHAIWFSLAGALLVHSFGGISLMLAEAFTLQRHRQLVV